MPNGVATVEDTEDTEAEPAAGWSDADRESLGSAGIAAGELPEVEQRRLRLEWLRNAPRSMEAGLLRAAKALADKLNREIAQGHDAAAFLIALFIATAKDGLDIMLDLIVIGEIPFVGQLPGIFLSAFLAYFLWGKGWFNKTKIRVAYYLLGFFFDNLPLFNDLPLNTLLVLWAWHVVRHRAAEAEAELQDLQGNARGHLAETGEEWEAE